MPEGLLVWLRLRSVALLAGLLPCPLDLGWVRSIDWPLSSRSGGYSAVAFEPQQQHLWLLNDLPAADLSAWTLPTPRAESRLLSTLPLLATGSEPKQPHPFILDGEGLVLSGDQAWVASEGRRSRERPALLLRFSRKSGTLLQSVALPMAWQPGEQRGLESNQGPESLARLSREGARLELLMAAEVPLQQDPPDQVRLLRWWWPQGLDPSTAAPLPAEQGALQAPDQPGWGLTDLVVLHESDRGREAPMLLTLWRRYNEPLQWSNQLRIYPLPAVGTVAQALHSWDLQSVGLTPENWEGMSIGPAMSAGQPSILLVSDDNLNPLQTSRLAVLEARRSPRCETP